MKRKTATIERYHVFGTMRHNLRVTYRRHTLQWVEINPGLCLVYADATDYGWESVFAMLAHAKRFGFTHCRFTGDWAQRTKPRGGIIGIIGKAQRGTEC